MRIAMFQENNFAIGFGWGVMLSLPLWLAIYGWITIIYSLLLL